MSPAVKEILEQALGLKEDDRAELAGRLLESLEPAEEAGVEAAWRDEVSRRVADLDSGAVKTVSWEEAQNRIFGKLDAREDS
jgi:putative addiction module component (TIGR02574 family)